MRSQRRSDKQDLQHLLLILSSLFPSLYLNLSELNLFSDEQNKIERYATFQIKKALHQDSKMQDLSNAASRTNGRWTKEEHLKFLEGLRIYGKNWKKIEQLVSTRTGTQIRSHAQKFFLKSKQASSTEQQNLGEVDCEFVDEQEEVTLNSKTSSGSASIKDQSYYLTKIIEYSNSKQCFDFWSALVDSRDATAILNKPIRNNSFIVYGQSNTILKGEGQKPLFNL